MKTPGHIASEGWSKVESARPPLVSPSSMSSSPCMLRAGCGSGGCLLMTPRLDCIICVDGGKPRPPSHPITPVNSTSSPPRRSSPRRTRLFWDRSSLSSCQGCRPGLSGCKNQFTPCRKQHGTFLRAALLPLCSDGQLPPSPITSRSRVLPGRCWPLCVHVWSRIPSSLQPHIGGGSGIGAR